MRCQKLILLAVAFFLLALVPQPALALFVGISGSPGDLDGDGDSSREDAVVRAAARCWAARITSDRSFVFTVWGEALSGGTIAQGWVSELSDDDIPTKGNLKIDNDGSNVYFIDHTPRDSSEWSLFDPASPWRLTGGPAGVDLFSVVIHEMGHALGWLCGEDSCGWDNPRFDSMMNPAPGDFTAGPMCVAPFPFWGQPALPGCVHLQSGAYDVSLRGDGLGDAVNQLSHTGISGDLMLGFYGGDDPRETMSTDDVAMFAFAYGDPVNLPPLIDAGPDLLSECNATGGSNVSLDGSGSNDPQGEALDYAWSCPGITLTGPDEDVASGFFPLDGDIVCRLDVSDVFDCPPVSDFVRVQVRDTTAPSISCPPGALVECTGDNGIEATDPQLAPFFSAVSSSDVCDASVAISNDAPSFFPLGATPVAFSASDDSGNGAGCGTSVTVQDTQLPTILVTLEPTRLWPPNHRMATVRATVIVDDVCDPNPTFVLTSITSSEPDNGLGDGDQPNDIQGAELGTPDLEFQLRSERSGTGGGRTYTIVYTVFDGSGNSSSATTEVFVPHDRRGGVMAGAGFENFARDPFTVETFDLVIASTKFFDARDVPVGTVRLGSSNGSLEAVRSRLADTTGDGLLDLSVSFDVGKARALRAASPGDPLAFRFETATGIGYLAPDVLALGHGTD